MADHHVLESSDKATLSRRASSSTEGPHKAVHPVLRLQSQVGNAQVARLLAQRAAHEDDDDKGIIMEQHDLTQRAGLEEE